MTTLNENLGTSYKLTEGHYGLDVLLPDLLDLNEKAMSVVLPFADGNRRDGVGDLLEVTGIRTERHQRNPIVLFDHGKHVHEPIALAQDPVTKTYAVVIDPVSRSARANCFFYQGKGLAKTDPEHEYQHALFCEQLFDLIAQRYIRAGSIGYQIIASRDLPPEFDSGIPKGKHLLSTLMLECSAVVLPANGDTVRKLLDLPTVCGKPLSPYLVKSLTPYTQPRLALLGYEKRPTKDQPMSDTLVKEGEAATKEGDDGSQDPLGAQVMRRVHEDFAVILEDYAKFLGPLEAPEVVDWLTAIIKGVKSWVSAGEKLFKKKYKGVEPLMKNEDVVGADSEEREEPTPAEAVAGMKYLESDMQKDTCAACGQDPCTCSAMKICQICGMENCDGTKGCKGTREVDDDYARCGRYSRCRKGKMNAGDRKALAEAHTLLGQLIARKQLGFVARAECAQQYLALKTLLTTPDGAGEKDAGDDGHWKALDGTAHFLADLADAKDFDGPLQEKAAHWHRALGSYARKQEEEEMAPEAEAKHTALDPALLKALRDSIAQQNRDLEALGSRFAAIKASVN